MPNRVAIGTTPLDNAVYIDKKGNRKKTAKYYGNYTDANGVRRRVALATDKAASEAMLHELRKTAERQREGIHDPFTDHYKQPLTTHIMAFEQHLTGKCTSERHVKQAIARVHSIVDGCGFLFINDIKASAVSVWMKEQRDTGRFGVATSNRYLASVKAFTKWLLRDRRMPEDVLSHIQKGNEAADRCHERRTLSHEVFVELLEATRNSASIFRGLNGELRYQLYLLASRTGFRASELASLTPCSFQLDADPPLISIAAKNEKARRGDSLPLPRDTAASLQEWLQRQASFKNDT